MLKQASSTQIKSLSPEQLVVGEAYLVDGQELVLQELNFKPVHVEFSIDGLPNARFWCAIDDCWLDFVFGRTDWYELPGWHPADPTEDMTAEGIIVQHSDPLIHGYLTKEEE
jgi:hypothetical protein